MKFTILKFTWRLLEHYNYVIIEVGLMKMAVDGFL